MRSQNNWSSNVYILYTHMYIKQTTICNSKVIHCYMPVGDTCNTIWESEIGRHEVWGYPLQIIHRPHLQHKLNKVNWRCGSNSRAIELHGQSLEFKPQSLKKWCNRKVFWRKLTMLSLKIHFWIMSGFYICMKTNTTND